MDLDHLNLRVRDAVNDLSGQVENTAIGIVTGDDQLLQLVRTAHGDFFRQRGQGIQLAATDGRDRLRRGYLRRPNK